MFLEVGNEVPLHIGVAQSCSIISLGAVDEPPKPTLHLVLRYSSVLRAWLFMLSPLCNVRGKSTALSVRKLKLWVFGGHLLADAAEASPGAGTNTKYMRLVKRKTKG